MNKLHEACGIIAIALNGSGASNAIVNKVYMGLLSIQHRGQESAGIAVAKDGAIQCYKDKGLVSEVFNEQILNLLTGEMCLGHVKYGGRNEHFSFNAEPTVIKYKQGQLAVAFNGALLNGASLRESMEDEGVIFTTQSDSEVIAALAARHDKGDIGASLQQVMKQLKGGYALGLMTGRVAVGARDPYGIRPLCLGRVAGGWAVASESCAFDMMDGEFVRDVLPGEIVVLENGTVTSLRVDKPGGVQRAYSRAGCVFEYVYFANPDSTIDGANVYQCRERAGYILAKEAPADADIVIGAPDSGTPAALGFSGGSGIPYTMGLIKNKYVGRTFIQPTQSQREMSVRIKLNPIKPIVAGKRIVLVDDSIVRGTTMRHLIAAIRQAGAAEVHLRISSPPVLSSCYFGVDTPDESDLIASHLSAEEVCASLGADSLAHISIEGMLESVSACAGQFCVGCFNGKYPEV